MIEDAAQGIIANCERPAARLVRRSSARSASTRRRTSSAARAARCCVNDPALVERAEIVREKGTNREPLLPRPGRQVHLGRHRLVVPPERDQRSVPLGAARAGRRDHRARGSDLERYHAAFAELEAAGIAAAPGRPGRGASTTRTCTTCSSRPRRRGRRSSADLAERGRPRRLPLRPAARLGLPAGGTARAHGGLGRTNDSASGSSGSRSGWG